MSTSTDAMLRRAREAVANAAALSDTRKAILFEERDLAGLREKREWVRVRAIDWGSPAHQEPLAALTANVRACEDRIAALREREAEFVKALDDAARSGST